jgi:hypothetical protein
MGQVISIESWLQGRGQPEKGRRGPSAPDVERLERAVARLEPLLDRMGAHPAGSGMDLETELLALSGAVSLGLYEEAADRAERLADRLASRGRRRG